MSLWPVMRGGSSRRVAWVDHGLICLEWSHVGQASGGVADRGGTVVGHRCATDGDVASDGELAAGKWRSGRSLAGTVLHMAW
ncbi:hypothetical protein GUJ93_ZPchr0006g42668 [Zizania palustris]|uniref:Uncharacterized protein n=1 Tax=Zizania palustris TaxID=103762 RepID=A0A8J5SI98_ZIZPA|nr:hypothetical protein GUJ93_ZPchr0006g42668 [Zizania palustris]